MTKQNLIFGKIIMSIVILLFAALFYRIADGFNLTGAKIIIIIIVAVCVAMIMASEEKK